MASNERSETFLAILCGLMKSVTTYFINVLSRLKNQLITRCVRLLTAISKRYVLVPDELMEGVMMEDNYIFCKECGEKVFYTPTNTVIYYFVEYPWYSVAQSVCECDRVQAYFLINNLEWELRWAIENDIGFVEMEGLPPENVLESFRNTMPDYPQYRVLSEQQEKEILFFAWVMEHDPIERWFDGQAEEDD